MTRILNKPSAELVLNLPGVCLCKCIAFMAVVVSMKEHMEVNQLKDLQFQWVELRGLHSFFAEELHRQEGRYMVMELRSPGGVKVSTLAGNSREVG